MLNAPCHQTYSYSLMACGKEGLGGIINESTESYNGMIGCVQRGEAIITQFVRPDSVPFEPGIFVAYSTYAETPKIYSMKPERIPSNTLDILYLWTNLDSQSWLYFIYTLTLTTILMIFINQIFLPTKNSVLLYISVHWLWKYFQFSVRIFNWKTLMFSQFLLITSTVISIFYGYHLIFMNTLSSDLTVSVVPRSIESLRDLLYDPQFQNVTPVIFGALNMPNLLKNSRIGTDEHVLYQKIFSDKKNSIIDIDFYNTNTQHLASKMSEVLKKTAQGLSIIIENSDYISLGIKYVGCFTEPEMCNRISRTKDAISPSPLMFLVSKTITPDYLKLFTYRMTTMSEFRTVEGYARTIAPIARESLFGKSQQNVEAIICIEKLENNYLESLNLPWKKFTLTPFERMLKFLTYFMSLAFFILLIEMVYFTQQYLQTKRIIARDKVIFEQRNKALRRINRYPRKYPR